MTALERPAARLRPLAGAVGRDQSLPAHFAGDHAAVQRRRRRASRCRSRSAQCGSLASFGATAKPHETWYGTYGNSFVAVVEFGKRVRAHAVTAGGESGHPQSPHFNDQARAMRQAICATVYFYPDQLKGHIERSYRPGE